MFVVRDAARKQISRRTRSTLVVFGVVEVHNRFRRRHFWFDRRNRRTQSVFERFEITRIFKRQEEFWVSFRTKRKIAFSFYFWTFRNAISTKNWPIVKSEQFDRSPLETFPQFVEKHLSILNLEPFRWNLVSNRRQNPFPTEFSIRSRVLFSLLKLVEVSSLLLELWSILNDKNKNKSQESSVLLLNWVISSEFEASNLVRLN